MKTNVQQLHFVNLRTLFFLFAMILMIASAGEIKGQTENINTNKSLDENVVLTLKELNADNSRFWIFRNNLQIATQSHKQAIQDLIAIFNDTKSKNATKRYAAYYLGVIKAAEATDSLAAQISLKPDHIISGSLGETESSYNTMPAVDALIAIGNPSIPAVIRNLAESDDAKTRELSLQVLTRIDGDKDISQLRLQKALKAEKDSQKQARLQAALNALAETSFGN